MGFITNILDVAKLARSLDRKAARPDREPHTAIGKNASEAQALHISDYIHENVFLPILSEGIIPIARLDFDNISEGDIDALQDVFENCDFDMLNFCAVLETFPPSAVTRKIII